jgi:formamidopyrimidine-DNA glycosylase
MPELPEVETVRRGLNELVKPPTRISAFRANRPDLRRPIPVELPRLLDGAEILAIERRAKWLRWVTDRGVLINHLGMTGSWRLDDGHPLPHDHVHITLQDGRSLIYRDPRRFGVVEWESPGETHPSFLDIGPEPLDDNLDGSFLRQALAGRRGPIKAALLDQRVIAGLGNIYVVEALFRAGIKPGARAESISRPRCQRLMEAIRSILTEAIAAGGSTISDFRQAGGAEGWFQHLFAVYGRAGEPCTRCGTTLTGSVMFGRSTVWCPRCQR